MAKRVKQLQLEEMSIEVYELKYGKFKEVINQSTKLIGAFFKVIDNPVMDLSVGIPMFIQDNLPELEKVFYQFTSLTPDTIDDIYITEIPLVLDEILKFYGFSIESIKDFFTNLFPKNPVTENMGTPQIKSN